MERSILMLRYEVAIRDLNNFHTGIQELNEPISLGWDMELTRYNLDDASIVEISPKSPNYVGHYFIIDIDSLSDFVLEQFVVALEDEVRKLAAWWDNEE